MPYRINPSYPDCFYHVYNRGNNFENIFFSEENYHFFLKQLIKYFKSDIDLIAYCLMPNHFHVIAKILIERSLENAMQRFSTSYTKAINKQQGRVGHLFQGRYKSKPIPGNEYLLHLSRYIHLNPVRAGLVRRPEQWEFSSYLEFIGKRKNDQLKHHLITKQINDYHEFVNSYQEEQKFYLKDLLFKDEKSPTKY